MMYLDRQCQPDPLVAPNSLFPALRVGITLYPRGYPKHSVGGADAYVAQHLSRMTPDAAGAQPRRTRWGRPPPYSRLSSGLRTDSNEDLATCV